MESQATLLFGTEKMYLPPLVLLGTHTLKWRYVKDSADLDGDDLAWVDYLQWSGETAPPESESEEWETTTYVYDPAGRRIAKAFDGDVAVRCVYDGPHCIAEYDANEVLLRKFLYGPGVDQPICMIEVQDANAAYYYHFDGLGSVVALSDAAGETVQTYEYSVYGEPAASDPNHPNPFLFTARRFDPETGLYHYRARAYNPYIGRFLQTDPAGQGMNAYAYCGNNATNCVDPSGMIYYGILDLDNPSAVEGKVTFACFENDGSIKWLHGFDDLDALVSWRKGIYERTGIDWTTLVGGELANGNEAVYWAVQVLIYLDPAYSSTVEFLEHKGVQVQAEDKVGVGSCYGGASEPNLVYWKPRPLTQNTVIYGGVRGWHTAPSLVVLAHELAHAYDNKTRGFKYTSGGRGATKEERELREQNAMIGENVFRYAFYMKVPTYDWVDPRPAYGFSSSHPKDYIASRSHLHLDVSWKVWWSEKRTPLP